MARTSEARHSDAALVAAAHAGDAAARPVLLDRYAALLKWQISRFVGEQPAAQRDDLAQEALLGFLRAVDTFEPRMGVRFSTYLTTCVRNALISAQRTSQRWRVREVVDSAFASADAEADGTPVNCEHDDTPSAYERLDAAERAQRIRSALSAREYRALVLRTRGFRPAEIAEQMGISEKSVSNALSRAQRKAQAVDDLP